MIEITVRTFKRKISIGEYDDETLEASKLLALLLLETADISLKKTLMEYLEGIRIVQRNIKEGIL